MKLIDIFQVTRIQAFLVLVFSPGEHQNSETKLHRCEDPTAGLQNRNLQGPKPGHLYFLTFPERNVQLGLRKPALRIYKGHPLWKCATRGFPRTGITRRPTNKGNSPITMAGQCSVHALVTTSRLCSRAGRPRVKMHLE